MLGRGRKNLLQCLCMYTGEDCLRYSANCYTRRDSVVNHFNSYDKENSGGHSTLYSFREFAVEALLLSGTNKHNNQVSWTTQISTTGPNEGPHSFHIMDCISNRRNRTVVKYKSVYGELIGSCCDFQEKKLNPDSQ